MDRTTRALRLRTEPIRSEPDVLLLTVALRWFNRISTWDTLYSIQPPGAPMALQSRWIAEMMSTDHGRHNLHMHMSTRGTPPWVTGAYIVQTETGLDKLAGVFAAIGRFAETPVAWDSDRVLGWRGVAELMLRSPGEVTLQQLQNWMVRHDRMGGFMAYEVVSDIRHTGLLDEAPDIMTWANAGPGAMRGLNRIHGRALSHSQSQRAWCVEMVALLQQSALHWPIEWPMLEMREIEHTLCEFDKYERVRLMEGTPRNKFRPTPHPLPGETT